jgi:hypothetical protein
MHSPRWFLAVGWLGVATAIEAQETARDSTPAPGAVARTLAPASAFRERARVSPAGGSRRAGWLLSADDTLLVLKPDPRPFVDLWTPRPVTYDRRQLARLELSEFPKRRGEATVVGAIVGAIAGAMIGTVALADKCVGGGLKPCHGKEMGLYLGGSLGLSVGGLLGRHVFGRERWLEIPTVGLPRP